MELYQYAFLLPNSHTPGGDQDWFHRPPLSIPKKNTSQTILCWTTQKKIHHHHRYLLYFFTVCLWYILHLTFCLFSLPGYNKKATECFSHTSLEKSALLFYVKPFWSNPSLFCSQQLSTQDHVFNFSFVLGRIKHAAWFTFTQKTAKNRGKERMGSESLFFSASLGLLRSPP